MSLDDDIKAADALGISYGLYKAKTFNPNKAKLADANKAPRKKKSRRKFTDEQAFSMWKQGKTDAEIGTALGVSRAMIQRWRDTLELPSVTKTDQRYNYRLENTEYGIFAIYEATKDLKNQQNSLI